MDTTETRNLRLEQLERLRELARQGRTVGDMVRDLRSGYAPASKSYITVLFCFKEAFHLTLREVLVIEESQCIYDEAISEAKSDEDLDAQLRPLILERLSLPIPPDLLESARIARERGEKLEAMHRRSTNHQPLSYRPVDPTENLLDILKRFSPDDLGFSVLVEPRRRSFSDDPSSTLRSDSEGCLPANHGHSCPDKLGLSVVDGPYSIVITILPKCDAPSICE